MKTSSSSYVRTTLTYLRSHKVITFCLLVVCFATLYYFYQKKPATVAETYSVSEVKLGSISNAVNGSGQIIPVNTLELKTKTSGDISEVLVKAGDKVVQGQALVKLNASQALQKVRTAEVNLASAKLDLQKLIKPAETLDVTLIKNQISDDEASIKNQDTLVATAYKNLLNASFEALSQNVNSSEVAPTITGTYLGGQEGQITISVYGTGDGSMFNVGGIASGTGYMNTVTAQPLGNSGLYIKFPNSFSNSNWNINIPNKKATNYLTLLTAYQNALDTKERTVASLQRSIEENKLKLDKLVKGADDLDIQGKKLIIQQRENDLAQAQSDYSDSIVTAPFDGIVATLQADIGTTVTSGISLGTIITDKKIAKISLNEVDVAKLTLGQKAKLTFDAIDGLVATSSVVEIDTLGTQTQGVVTYDVKLLFSQGDERVKPGMSVTADILSTSKDNVLLLPLSAVTEDKTGLFVEKVVTKMTVSSSTRKMATKPEVVRTTVTTGISNDRFIEITSGLAQGDQVIITKKVSSANATPKAGAQSAPTASSILNGGGAGRRQGGF
jgi:HlyD family secretion protein